VGAVHNYGKRGGTQRFLFDERGKKLLKKEVSLKGGYDEKKPWILGGIMPRHEKRGGRSQRLKEGGEKGSLSGGPLQSKTGNMGTFFVA